MTTKKISFSQSLNSAILDFSIISFILPFAARIMFSIYTIVETHSMAASCSFAADSVDSSATADDSSGAVKCSYACRFRSEIRRARAIFAAVLDSNQSRIVTNRRPTGSQTKNDEQRPRKPVGPIKEKGKRKRSQQTWPGRRSFALSHIYIELAHYDVKYRPYQ